MVGTYAPLIAVLFFLIRANRMQSPTGLVIIAVFVAAQFLLGPWAIEISLRRLGPLQWVGYNELPSHLDRFIQAVCQARGLRPPRIGLVDDGTPNAFTYGIAPGDARLVLTRGLLEKLEEAELRAAVAHELGHIRQADFIFMTLAQMVPFLIYEAYLFSAGSAPQGRGGPRRALASAFLTLYRGSRIGVLFLSRAREYWADRFSLETTADPIGLISAQVQIGNGLVDLAEPPGAKRVHARRLGALQAMGIAELTESPAPGPVAAQASDRIPTAESLAWDLASRWAGYYELASAHPAAAKRFRAIASRAAAMGIKSAPAFEGPAPEKRGRFTVELVARFAPLMAGVGGLALGQGWRPAVAGFALASLVTILLRYPRGAFVSATVAELIPRPEVSPIRAIPVTLQGTVGGPGFPEAELSQGLFLKDATGYISLDPSQGPDPFGVLFGVLRGGKYLGDNVVVEGWYRRGPMPYLEISRLRSGRFGSILCYRRLGSILFWCAVALASIAF